MHQPILVPDENCPNVFDVFCTCGAGPANTPWGEAAAAEIYAIHLWRVGAIKDIRPNMIQTTHG
jgi:hypothetical protein